MGLGKKLTTLGLTTALAISSIGSASFFHPISPGNDYVTLEGRLSFLDRFAKNGDEVGIFVDDACLGSSNLININQSHYYDLKIDKSLYNDILKRKFDYNIKAYNVETNSLWKVEVMGVETNSMHFRAYENLGYVPEPSTLALILSGLLFAKRKQKSL